MTATAIPPIGLREFRVFIDETGVSVVSTGFGPTDAWERALTREIAAAVGQALAAGYVGGYAIGDDGRLEIRPDDLATLT
jgi:hypothetical protein